MALGTGNRGAHFSKNGGSAKQLTVSRREFVIGAAALTLAGGAVSEESAQIDILKFYGNIACYELQTELRFEWDPEAKILLVHEALSTSPEQLDKIKKKSDELEKEIVKQDAETKCKTRENIEELWQLSKVTLTWRVHLGSMDPDPQINLGVIGADGHKLTIAFSGQQIFLKSLEPDKDPALRKLILKFQRAEQTNWQVEASSDYWAIAGKNVSLGVIPLRDLITQQSAPSEDLSVEPWVSLLSSKQAQETFGQLFGRQFLLSGGISLGLDANLAWHIRPKTGDEKAILAFGQQVVVSHLYNLNWKTPKEDEEGKLDRETRVSMDALGDLTGNGIVLGDKTAMHVHVHSQIAQVCEPAQKVTSPLLLKVYRSNRALTTVVELKLDCKRWTFKVENGKDDVLERMSAAGKLERTEVKSVILNVAKFETKASMVAVGPDPQYGVIRFASSKKDLTAPYVPITEAPFDLKTYLGTLQVSNSAKLLGMPKQEKSPTATTDPNQNKIESEKTETFPLELLITATDSYKLSAPEKVESSLESFHLKLGLLRAPYALRDSSFSRLKFRSSSLSIIYDVRKIQLPASYIWLEPESQPQEGVVRFDLTRAELVAQNAVEMLSLKFRFTDLAFVFAYGFGKDGPKTTTRQPPRIVPLPMECRIMAGQKPLDFLDTRPRLIVEFPPQHVFEEALFRPQQQSPPELSVDGLSLTGTFKSTDDKDLQLNPRLLAIQLLKFPRSERQAARNAWRKYVDDQLKKLSAKEQKPAQPFLVFAEKFKNDPELRKLPDDQQVYIGPFGMEPDAAVIARKLILKGTEEWLGSLGAQLAAQVVEKRQASLDGKGLPNEISDKRKLEARLDAEFPLYAVFRVKYAEQFLKMKLGKESNPNFTGMEQEYFLSPDLDAQDKLANAFKLDYFVKFLKGEDPIPDVVRARLSNPSRLVFAIDCGPSTHVAEELPPHEQKPAIDFSLAALTDWSKHELVVVRRAQKLYETDAHGLLGSIDKRVATISDKDILLFQGIKPGSFKTSQQRLSDIASSMRDPPRPDETAIEIPARLTLSPSQDAIWITPHELSRFRAYYPADEKLRQDQEKGIGAAVSEIVDPDLRPLSGDRALWSTTLDHMAAEPNLRAVHSPDFRPGFFWSKFEQHWQDRDKATLIRLLGNRPPPKGPLAPWYLGRETNESSNLTAEDAAINADYIAWREGRGESVSDTDDLCARLKEQAEGRTKDQPWLSVPRLFDYLCGRRTVSEAYGKAAIFRSSLDAYDRHELVLLSSAYGLPVQGRRQLSGQLTEDSEQFEPPPGFELVDILDDSAIYRPKTLKIRELTLSSVGGTFRHETAFQPPSAALHMTDSRIYDSLSIEKWQHWAVLGRDVYVEVVYKGFLFPLGLRASLVKVTERTFLKNERGFIKAYLRQRMFIRCANPTKGFPAMRQPNGGRQFPCETLKLLTVTTPDIVDPTLTIDQGKYFSEAGVKTFLNGRIKRATGEGATADFPGLVFWPRTALTEDADIQFDFSIEGRTAHLPLIFVDNTAAQETIVLAALVKYYNGIKSPDGIDNAKCVPHDLVSREHKRSFMFT